MKIDKNTIKSFSVVTLAALALTAMPEASFAGSQGGGPWADKACDIAGWFNGGTGRAIATIAVIFLGIAAFFGKVTWGLALMFAVGIFAIFGAGDIIAAVSDGGGCDTSTTPA